MPICHRDKGSYCGQAQKKCYLNEKFVGPRDKTQPLDQIDEWIKNSQEYFFYCLVRASARKKAQKCSKKPLPRNRKYLGAQCLL